MANSVYNVNEQSYVTICANRTGDIEGALPLNLDVTSGTADGKQRHTRVHRHSHTYTHGHGYKHAHHVDKYTHTQTHTQIKKKKW